MVSKDEIIKQLIEVGIITCIDNQYILTEKYKDLLSIDASIKLSAPRVEVKSTIDRNELLNPKTSGNEWPVEIAETTGRNRASAFMDICEIPATGPESAGSYRIRGLDNDAVNIIGNIVNNRNISPLDMIESIKQYYTNTLHPKAFKNYLKDGDVADVYEEFIAGPKVPKDSGKRWS